MGETGVSGHHQLPGPAVSGWKQNLNLINQLAYGQPGTRTWGEWETVIRTDPAVAASLDLVVAPLREAELTVLAGENAEDEKLAQTQADYLRDNLTLWLEPLWVEVCQQVVRGMLGYGFAIQEPVLDTREDDRLPGGFGYYLKKLAQRLPASLEYNAWAEKDDELVAVYQRGLKSGNWVTYQPLLAEKMLLWSWNREGNNYAGFSAFRPVWYLCKIREHLLKIIGIGHQREALGVPMAEMDPNAPLTPRQRAKLRRVLENLVYHENAAIVLPPGVKLTWFNAPGANKGHVLDTWRQLGLAIMETLQAQQMALGTSNTGARAVGDVHDAAKNGFVRGVKAAVEGVLNGIGSRRYTGLAKHVIDPNWGPQKVYPRISLTLSSTDLDPASFAAAAAAAATAGLITWRHVDENRLRDALGLDEIEQQEYDDIKSAKAAMLTAVTGQQMGNSEKPEDEAKDSAKKNEGAPGQKPADQNAPAAIPPPAGTARPPPADGEKRALSTHAREALVFASSGGQRLPYKRSLKSNEGHLAWDDMDDLLSGARDMFSEQARPLLAEMLVRALPGIRKALADGDPSEVADIHLDTSRLGELVDAFLAKMKGEGMKHVARESATQPKKVIAKRQMGMTPAPAAARARCPTAKSSRLRKRSPSRSASSSPRPTRTKSTS